MTSRYNRSLPLTEEQEGVRVVRVPVAFRVSKGVIMPTFGFIATRLVRSHDVVSLHLPQFDAAGVAARARLMGKPSTLTYHCDLKLPAGPFNGFVNRVVDVMNYLAGLLADRVIAYTDDFAVHSPFLSRFAHKTVVIPPPVELPPASPEEVEMFARRVGLDGRGPVIGMAARLAAEKGVEVLLEALPRVLEVYPNARVLFAGQYQNVLGEEAYARRLAPLLEKYRDRWTFLGVLSPKEMAAFYSQSGRPGRLQFELHRVLRPGPGRGHALRDAVHRQRPARRPPAGPADGDGRNRAGGGFPRAGGGHPAGREPTGAVRSPPGGDCPALEHRADRRRLRGAV
jgi:glycosyltransferase involved in cell wall biosynthesis